MVVAMLRRELGCKLGVLLVEESAERSTAGEELYRRLSAYPEVQVTPLRIIPGAEESEIDVGLAEAARRGDEVVLVWTEGGRTLSGGWTRQVLDAAERINLFDSCFVALIGAEVGRQDARRLGYEDGFNAATPLDALMVQLAREVAAHREMHRCGSSPPCYL
jgi:hypothetical protein